MPAVVGELSAARVLLRERPGRGPGWRHRGGRAPDRSRLRPASVLQLHRARLLDSEGRSGAVRRRLRGHGGGVRRRQHLRRRLLLVGLSIRARRDRVRGRRPLYYRRLVPRGKLPRRSTAPVRAVWDLRPVLGLPHGAALRLPRTHRDRRRCPPARDSRRPQVAGLGLEQRGRYDQGRLRRSARHDKLCTVRLRGLVLR